MRLKRKPPIKLSRPIGGRIIVVEGFEHPKKKAKEPEPPKLSEEERYRELAGDLLLTEEEIRYRRSLGD